MARAYSDDMRRKFLEAYQAGDGSLATLAARFHVSIGWAEAVSAAFGRTGRMERAPGAKRGRKSRITAGALEYLAGRVKQQPDRTLEKLREDLERERGIIIGVTQLWVVLSRMGLRFKKRRSMPPNRTVRVSRLKGSSGANRPGKSTRNDLSL
jgi:transposase